MLEKQETFEENPLIKSNLKISPQESNTQTEKKLFSFKDYKTTFNIISTIFLILSTTLYLFSLKGCDKSQSQCLGELTRRLVIYFVTSVITASFLFSLNYIFSLYNLNNRIISLFQTFILLYLTFVHDTGYNLKNHGGFNRIFLFLVMFVSFIAQNIGFFWIFLMRKKFLPVFILLVVSTSSFSILFYNNLTKNCESWNEGLRDTQFQNESNICKLKTPRFCWMNMFNKCFDIS